MRLLCRPTLLFFFLPAVFVISLHALSTALRGENQKEKKKIFLKKIPADTGFVIHIIPRLQIYMSPYRPAAWYGIPGMGLFAGMWRIRRAFFFLRPNTTKLL